MTHTIYMGLPDRSKREFRKHVAATTPELIIKAVCSALEITLEQITGPTRKREIVEARHLAIGLILESFPVSLKKLGAMFNRDHSTMIYARDTYYDLMETNKDFQKKAALVKL